MNKIKQGDVVKVISGSYKGETGKVIKTSLAKNRILVEGINIAKKHLKPNQENPQGGIIEKEMSIHISNVMLMFKNNPTKVAFDFDKNGKKIRINKKDNKKID